MDFFGWEHWHKDYRKSLVLDWYVIFTFWMFFIIVPPTFLIYSAGKFLPFYLGFYTLWYCIAGFLGQYIISEAKEMDEIDAKKNAKTPGLTFISRVQDFILRKHVKVFFPIILAFFFLLNLGIFYFSGKLLQ